MLQNQRSGELRDCNAIVKCSRASLSITVCAGPARSGPALNSAYASDRDQRHSASLPIRATPRAGLSARTTGARQARVTSWKLLSVTKAWQPSNYEPRNDGRCWNRQGARRASAVFQRSITPLRAARTAIISGSMCPRCAGVSRPRAGPDEAFDARHQGHPPETGWAGPSGTRSPPRIAGRAPVGFARITGSGAGRERGSRPPAPKRHAGSWSPPASSPPAAR